MRNRATAPHRIERVLFASPHVVVGEWCCVREHPQFSDTGPTRRCVIAFPRTSVGIAHEGQREFIADAGVATIYNRGQRYTRRAIHPDGDRCDWFAIDDRWARDIASTAGATTDDEGRPFRFDRAPVEAALYLRQREWVSRLRQREVDEVEAEEGVLRLVDEVYRAATQAWTGRVRPPGEVPARRELARQASDWLAASFRERVGLAALAQQLGTSAFHLSRVFREHTGSTLHRHLTRLRLRAVLEPLAERTTDLTTLALDHGFCSHSHFTAAFTREFGVTPSAWRARLHMLSQAARRQG